MTDERIPNRVTRARPRLAFGATGALFFGMAVLAGCSGRSADRQPGPAPAPPDLSGETVMLLPVRLPAPDGLDAELARWLGELHPTIEWLPPDELQAAVDRVPAWRLRLAAIQRPVVDMGGGDRRVVDPLYAALRQLGGLVHADYAVVPVGASEKQLAGVDVLEMAVAVVDIRGGRVLWLHTLRGEGNPDGGGAVASLAEAVARSLMR